MEKDRKEFVPGDLIMVREKTEILQVDQFGHPEPYVVENIVRPTLYGVVCSFSPLLKEVYVALKAPYDGGIYHKFSMDECKNLGPPQDTRADNMARRTPRSMRI